MLWGGAFLDGHWYVRCAYRFWNGTFYSDRVIGFRVVVLTCSGASIVRRGDPLFRAEAKHGRACSWPRPVMARPGK